MTDALHSDRSVPTSPELRKFGLSVGGAFVVLFGFVLPWLFSFETPYWPFVVGAVLMLPALVAPRVLGPIHRAWMWAALKIGAFNTKVILSVVFYLVFTPVGVLRRAFGADALGRRDTAAATYRKPSRRRTPQSLERPF